MQNNTMTHLPQGWEVKTIENVCKNSNSNLALKDIKDKSGDYPVFGASGIVGYVDFFHKAQECLGIIKDGAGVGRVFVLPKQSSVIGTLSYLENNKTTNLKYLFYFLKNLDFSKYILGSAIPHIYFRDYKKEQIPLPPLKEQGRIAGILDLAFEKIDTSVELLKANLANLDELAQSVLDRAFNPLGDSTDSIESTQNPSTHDAQSPYPLPQHWEWKSLGEMCKILNGGTPDTKNPVFWDLNQSHEVQTDKSVVGVGGEVERGEGATSQFKPLHPLAKEKSYYWATLVDTKQKYLYSTQRKITQKGLDSSNATLLPVNSVIFSSRASIGEVCIAKVETATNQGYKNFVCDENVLYYEFLYFALQRFAKEIESLAQGTTYKEVSKAKISEFQIPLPKDIKEQEQIAMHLDSVFDKIQKLKELYNAQLQDYEELKQSLLTQAFSGKL